MTNFACTLHTEGTKPLPPMTNPDGTRYDSSVVDPLTEVCQVRCKSGAGGQVRDDADVALCAAPMPAAPMPLTV
jgi:hypothetical protein